MIKTLATPLSLNELNFYLIRAIFGIGGSFSVATECARACSWLVRQGLPIDELLQGILSRDCPASPEFCWSSEGEQQILQSDKDTVPALYAGLAVGDHLCFGHKKIQIAKVDFPLLLAAQIIPRLPKNTAWKLSLGKENHLIIAGDKVWLKARTFDKNCAVLIETTTKIPSDAPIIDCATNVYQQGIDLQNTTWDLLWQCFHKTLVPSNPESHLQGAGAGTNDND